jgi:hypothetical protein
MRRANLVSSERISFPSWGVIWCCAAGVDGTWLAQPTA